MNQLCKNLVTKSILIKNALNPSKLLDNRYCLVNQSLKSFSSAIILKNDNNLNSISKRLYVTKSEPNSSLDFKYKREYSGGYRPRDRNIPRKQFDLNRRKNEDDLTRSKEEDFENAEPVEATGKLDYSNKEHHSFKDFDIPEKLLNQLEKLGYTSPFEIQEKTLKHTLSGRDLVGKAFTGSGKTLAFAIPIISRIMKSENKQSRYPKCLVLSPTRELCLQLTKTIQDLAPEMKCLSILGGTGYESQISALNRKVDIVCATPGRLRDLMNRKNFIADDIEIVCLDEADELLNPNFSEQIHDVIEMTSKKQMLMFSATINKSVLSLIGKYMKSPITVDLTEGQTHKLPSNIEHYFIRASNSSFDELALHCIRKFDSERCIIFTNMKREAIRLNYTLSRSGLKSSDLHSDLSQRKREIILDKFRNGKINVIVATDVAARGIDIPEIDLVVQLGAPINGVDFYIHRSGRTGRAGRIGRSILIDDGSKNSLIKMVKKLVKFKKLELPESLEQKIKEEVSMENDNDDDVYQKDNYFIKRSSKFNRPGFMNRSYNSYSNRDDFRQKSEKRMYKDWDNEKF